MGQTSSVVTEDKEELGTSRAANGLGQRVPIVDLDDGLGVGQAFMPATRLGHQTAEAIPLVTEVFRGPTSYLSVP